MFDPFLDFQSAGYLRNVERLKDPERVKRLEHFFFESNLEEASHFLSRQRGPVTYPHFLQVHRILFHEFYPWAGQDRQQLGVGRIVTKGQNVQFELSERSRQAVEWGLRDGNDQECMRRRPGGIMGAFAWGHPFLDGNGRTMLLVHAELCHRAGFSIDWLRSSKSGYLSALTHELAHPQDHVLDAYFAGLRSASLPRDSWLDHIKSLPGHKEAAKEPDHADHSQTVAHDDSRYAAIRRTRDEQDAENNRKNPKASMSRGRRVGF